MATVVALAGPGLAYPPGTDGTCDQVNSSGGSTTVSSGQSITVSGQAASGTQCFDGGATVTIHFLQSDHIIATTTASSNGNYSATGSVPSTVHSGAASVEAVSTLNGTTQSYTTAVTVAGGSGGLPKTGQDIALLVGWALALVAIGTVLIRLVRRRKQRVAA